MNRFRRAQTVASFAYPVLMVIAFVAFPAPPGTDTSPAADLSWLSAHTGTVIAQSYVRAAGALGFLILSVALARRFTGTAARSVLAGGAVTAGLILVAQTAVLAAAFGAREDLPHDALRLADPLNAALLDVSSIPAILLFAATATALLHDRTQPRWLGWLTALGIPLAAIDALSYTSGPFAAFGLVGLAYFLLWSLLTAVWLSRSPRTTPIQVQFAN